MDDSTAVIPQQRADNEQENESEIEEIVVDDSQIDKVVEGVMPSKNDSMPRPDPVNDYPADFIDVVATDSPTKQSDNNVIRVIPAAPQSTATLNDDDDERKILEGLRKAREPPKIVRRIFVRRDPNTGGLLVDKNNMLPKSQEQKSLVALPAKPTKAALLAEQLPTVTDEECIRAAEATKEFTSKLRSLKLTPKQKDSIVSYAGSLVDKLITITKESKDREILQKMEDDRLWLRNEIDSIIEKRLGSVRVNNTRQFWRNETEKLTEMALTNLMVYRENGTRKQDVLTSALSGFTLGYIQAHRNGIEIISTIKKMRSNFVDHPRACRAFVDVCAEFLMNNCFEKHFPCNAEKYALLRHCEQIFDIKLDYKFFTLENGTGKLDRRIRTIRTTDYKKGGMIQRKRKPLKKHPKIETKTESDDEEDDTKVEGAVKKEEAPKRQVVKRTWTRQGKRPAVQMASTSMGTRGMVKRGRFAPFVSLPKIPVVSQAEPKDGTPVEVAEGESKDVRDGPKSIESTLDNVNEVELPKDE